MPTKQELRTTLSKYHGIDFGADFHTLNRAQVMTLRETALKVKFRQSPSASGSLGRSFYSYLQKVRI